MRQVWFKPWFLGPVFIPSIPVSFSVFAVPVSVLLSVSFFVFLTTISKNISRAWVRLQMYSHSHENKRVYTPVWRFGSAAGALAFTGPMPFAFSARRSLPITLPGARTTALTGLPLLHRAVQLLLLRRLTSHLDRRGKRGQMHYIEQWRMFDRQIWLMFTAKLIASTRVIGIYHEDMFVS